jgi:hypothetical protein
MKITLNGQLLLCMLAESLMKVPTLRLLMINTDGLEYRVSRDYAEVADVVCREWEQLTSLSLEGTQYSRMWITNVNNYIAESMT